MTHSRKTGSGILFLVEAHTSLLDGPLIALRLGLHGYRRCIFPVDPAWSRHFFWKRILKVIGFLTGGHRILPLSPESPFSMRALAKALSAGETVVLFPTGGLVRNGFIDQMPGAEWLKRYAHEISILEISTMQKHPHGRGENECKSQNCVFHGETPPRAWGKHPLQAENTLNARNTPTGVGKTSIASPIAPAGEKHPHGRGENLRQKE